MREINDQHYRYYQCHGGLAIALLGVMAAWSLREPAVGLWAKAGVWVLFAGLEVALAWAALDALRRMRAKATDVQNIREVA